MKRLGNVLTKQMFRFGIVGICGCAVNYSVFYVFLTYLGIDYLIAGAIGFLVTIPFVFFVNRMWTFQSDLSYASGLPLYVVTNIVALGAHSTTQWFARETLGVPEIFSQLFGIVSSAIVNFLLAKVVVFRDGVKIA